MPGRHFHFALEFSDEAPIGGVTSDLVSSVLCHAGLSIDHAAAVARQVLAAARGGAAGPCRVQFDSGVDEIQILVTHAGAATWRRVCAVE